jgi:hypothetical protein
MTTQARELTDRQAATLRLWEDTRGDTPVADYLLHEGTIVDRLGTSPQGARRIANNLVRLEVAMVDSWDDGDLLLLTDHGLGVLRHLLLDPTAGASQEPRG